MQLRAIYEWVIEVVEPDSEGDTVVIATEHSAILRGFVQTPDELAQPEYRLAIVKDEVNIQGNVVLNSQAYVCFDAGAITLPESFSDDEGMPTVSIPKRFKQELASWVKSYQSH